jgi:Holliday junction resolvase RusA-like endonuclease
MTEILTLTVPGAPTPKGRPRSTRTGNHYTPETTRVAESVVQAAWLTTVGLNREPHPGPVEIEIASTFPVPISWPKWKRQLALFGEIPHTTKPDTDNLVKLITDALNGHAYHDDAQAFRVVGRKQYGPTASTLVTLTFIPSPTKPNPKGK